MQPYKCPFYIIPVLDICTHTHQSKISVTVLHDMQLPPHLSITHALPRALIDRILRFDDKFSQLIRKSEKEIYYCKHLKSLSLNHKCVTMQKVMAFN